jgi:hypothetical protein
MEDKNIEENSMEVTIGRVRSDSGLGRTGRVGLTFWKKSDRIGSGSGPVRSIYILCFFRTLIDFDWIKKHLISDRIGFRSE